MPASKTSNPLAIVSVVAVGLVLIIQFAVSILTAVLLRSSNVDTYATYTAIGTISVFTQGALALAAIVTGAIGLSRRGRPKGLAGIGLGGGIVVLFGIVVTELTNLFARAMS